jgi:two-component system phosphate regulon response regulator OmpR
MAHIVVYEDNDLMRDLLKEWLSEAGYRVSALAPREPSPTGPVDLVIVSVYMPKNGGAHLVKEVHAAHPGTPVIAISGQFRSGLSAAGATAQALDVHQVIAKPLSRADLLASIRAIMCTSSRTGC